MTSLLKKNILVISFLSSVFLSNSGFAQNEATTTLASSPSIAGYWQTIDDEKNQPRSIIQICVLKNGSAYGRVINVYYRDGESPNDTCDLCSKHDPRYKQSNLGMIILTDLRHNFPNVWEDGRVLDPHNGKVYDAKVTLAPDGKTLTMRGYIGISLLGRSQTWNYLNEQAVQNIVGKVVTQYPNGYAKTSTGKYIAEGYNSCAVMQKEVDQMTN